MPQTLTDVQEHIYNNKATELSTEEIGAIIDMLSMSIEDVNYHQTCLELVCEMMSRPQLERQELAPTCMYLRGIV